MPYFLKQVGKKYFVVDTTGKTYSHKPLSKVRAEKQLKALHINTGHGLYGGNLMQILSEIAQQGYEAFRDFLFRNPEYIAAIFGVIAVNVQQIRQLFNSVKQKGDGLYGGNKWDYVRLIAEDIKKVQKRNKTLASRAGTTQPYPYQIGRNFSRIYTPTLDPLPNVQEELSNLVQNGTIDQRDVQYYQSKIDEYLSLHPYKQPLFKVPDPIYAIRQPEVLLGRPGTQETAESALLNLPVGNQHVAQREAVEQAVAQRYVAGLPTRAQVQQSQQQSEAQQQARKSLAEQQGTIEQSQDPRELQRGFGKYSQPDIHILIGDELLGSGSGKWTALINSLARMYNIPKVLVDSTIALNDRQYGKHRFSAKKQNILSQFSDYLNPTIVSEISGLDESDPNSVSDYANTIDGRRDMALSLRTINTVNPLQVSVSTANPLSGRGRKLKGGLNMDLFEQIIRDSQKEISDNPKKSLESIAKMFKRMIQYLDPVQKEKLDSIQNMIVELMRQAKVSIDKKIYSDFFKPQSWATFLALLGLNEAFDRENALGQEAYAQALASSAKRHAKQEEVQAYVEPEEEHVQAQVQTERTGYAPQQARTGQGKLKFIKKYLKGQGLPATKKNVQKICNIMDVEGVLFE